MTAFHKARYDDIPGITKMMADSFISYPFVAHFLKNSFQSKEKERQFLEKTCNVLVKALLRNGICFFEKQEHEVRAFCILSTIENMKLSAWDLLASGAMRLLPYLFQKRVLQFILFYLKDAAVVHAPENKNTWYVHLFAVSPHHQGKQLGSALMNHCIIPYVKQKQGAGIFLATNTEMALTFYMGNGFQMIAHDEISNRGERFQKWDLFRPINKMEAKSWAQASTISAAQETPTGSQRSCRKV